MATDKEGMTTFCRVNSGRKWFAIRLHVIFICITYNKNASAHYFPNCFFSNSMCYLNDIVFHSLAVLDVCAIVFFTMVV